MPETLPTATVRAAGRECWLPRHRRSAGVARRMLRAYLAEQPDGGRYADDGELLLGELVANAVAHATAPPGRLVLVGFELAGGELAIEVHDASPDGPDPAPVDPDAEDESGRGLWLVGRLATAWGVRPRPGGVGKIVWCVYRPAGAGAA
ncbi:ATP-binding protein [Kitasatospora sp. NPDC059571]|uniref:ATP-binding protein n=1 Tax=Kitasatospora sp. NPDC059571 TaxID=3346871 RepID=UPI00369DFDAA